MLNLLKLIYVYFYFRNKYYYFLLVLIIVVNVLLNLIFVKNYVKYIFNYLSFKNWYRESDKINIYDCNGCYK